MVTNKGFLHQFATRTNGEGGRELDSNHISLWNSLSFVSGFIIQFIAPWTADRFGRKFNLWFLTFWLTLSIILEIVAKDWIVLLLSRLCSGCAGGLIGTSMMIYMSEISLPQFRGALLGSFSLTLALGQMFLAFGLKILEVTNEMAFRNMFYSEFVFLGFWLIPVILLPESPGMIPWSRPRLHLHSYKADKRTLLT